MNLKQLNPKQALNKAYLKQKITRQDIESFKYNLGILLAKIDHEESEENAKNHVIAFLRDTYYKDKNEVNTKGRIDLVIHLDSTPKSKAGVLIEAKRPVNKSEMITKSNLNAKAMQELILYYLQERIDENNIDIKFVVATNIYEWFIFDASVFDKLFYKNKALVHDYEDWRDGRKARTDTGLFYTDIAKPFLDNLNEEIEFTYFNFRDYIDIIKNEYTDDDNLLVSLYKLLSPEHLLKQSFANDSNSLDPKFYSELLHIIGLEEVKEGSKKIIRRKQEGKRNPASLLENTINTILVEDRLRKIKDLTDYGDKQEERLFNVALELCITWINRILFLKLLEAQLLKYHSGDKKFKFLDIEKIPDYDELNKLFFQVLAKKINERSGSVREKYSTVPYLNSSLFEMTALEDDAVRINSLDNDIELDIISTTVLKDIYGYRKVKPLPALSYLFEFLDAYDFTSEGSDIIQEENKTLINASVLGLIFEKINGYKDGSIFTPGFITMFMSREALRLAVVQKYKEKYSIEIESFNDLKVFTGRHYSTDKIKEFNQIINTLKICDPAVGSGHFLVSCLNELIAIKSELGILAGDDNIPFNKWSAAVENDELILTDREGNIFEYVTHANPTPTLPTGEGESKGGFTPSPVGRAVVGFAYIHPEIQKIQKTLFNEKKTIIENCLFGVDINPNSVKICRLRLWIELLKNAYYTGESNFAELETLPNIDINIKCGNSLISRFAVDADLSKALKTIKWNINDYRILVNEYKETQDKEKKRGIETLIADIKNNFRSEIGKYDPKVLRLDKLTSEYYGRFQQVRLIDTELSPKQKDAEKKARQKMEAEITKLSAEIEDIKNNAIYRNAFEWRFEFPEVLDDDGNFMGFDVVIGNPPYGADIPNRDILKNLFPETSIGQIDTYKYFINLTMNISKLNSYISYITSDSYLEKQYFKDVRQILFNNASYLRNIKLGDEIFEDINLPTAMFLYKKGNPLSKYEYKDLSIIKNMPEKRFNLINLTGYLNDIPDITISFSSKTSIINPIDCFKLIEIYDQVMGVKVYQIGKGKPKQTAYEFENNIFVKNEKINENYYPFISQGIGRYTYKSKEEFINYGEWLAEPRKLKYFIDEKIIVREIVNPRIFATYIDYPSVIKNIAAVIVKKNDKFELKYLLALLNSNLFTFYLYEQTPKSNNKSYPSFTSDLIKNIPVKNISLESQLPFINLVNQILAIKKENPQADTTELEKEIDLLVYKLYELTDEEIKIVEGK